MRSMLAGLFLVALTATGCHHIAGVCDCDPEPDPCYTRAGWIHHAGPMGVVGPAAVESAPAPLPSERVPVLPKVTNPVEKNSTRY